MKLKEDIRAEMLKKRREYDKEQKEKDEIQIKESILKNIQIDSDFIVAGYSPILEEVDITPTLYFLSSIGVSLALPIIKENYNEMSFHFWGVGETLNKGPFNTYQPNKSNKITYPDIVFVPLLAFDSKGYRIGYGKGFYDKILKTLREYKEFRAYGIGFDWQEVSLVPKNKFDFPLDGVFTPKKFFKNLK